MPITHAFVSAKSDGGDATLVRPSNWNADHVGSSAPFKRTVAIGTGNKTISSATFGPVDATNLAYLTLTLAINDVVECIFSGQHYLDTTAVAGFDFEVDQPTSANVRVADAAEYGALAASSSGNRIPMTVVGYFTATEAGAHGFRPVAKVSTGNMTIPNGTSGTDDTALTFRIQNLGPVTA